MCPKYDVGFILDRSTSLNEEQFDEQKLFAIRVAKLFNLAPNEGKASVMTFNHKGSSNEVGEDSRLEIKFSDHDTYTAFRNEARKIEYCNEGGCNTNIIGALEYGLNEMFQSRNGMRTGPRIEKIAFLITDGDSNRGPRASSDFRRLKAKYEAANIKLFIIGIGNVDESKLNLLVENPLTHVILIENFNDLNDVLIQQIGQSICEGK